MLLIYIYFINKFQKLRQAQQENHSPTTTSFAYVSSSTNYIENRKETFEMERLYLGYSPDSDSDSGTQAWNGLMQETLLYDRIVSDTEINILYQNSKYQITEDLGILLGVSPNKINNPNYTKMLQDSFFNSKDITDISYVLDEPNSVAITRIGIKFLNIFYNDKEIIVFESNQ